jgi:hypothetical protein
MGPRKYSDLIPIQNTPLREIFYFRMGSDSFKFKVKVVHILKTTDQMFIFMLLARNGH